ncbi:MAG: response regulator [Alphaproteobacteria bacterium]|nr:response regulator [Alphaproteobacteria bacterium]
MSDKNLVPILILEDNDVDVEIVRRAFRKDDIQNPLYVAEDGAVALDILNGEKEDRISQPCLILVDINMPRMDGFSFLEAVHSDERLKKNVPFMLTTSRRESDMERAYGLKVAGYLLKDDIGKVSTMLAEYLRTNKWLGHEDAPPVSSLQSGDETPAR